MVTIVGEDPAAVVLKWDGPQGGTMLPVGRLVRQALAADARRRRPRAALPALRPELLDLQRNQRPGLPRRAMRDRLRRARYGRTGRERGAALPLPAVRHRHPDGQLELDGHLGLVLPFRGLRPRHPQRDGQLARLGEPLPPLEDLRRQHREPDGLLGGQQHERRARSASSISPAATPGARPTSITGNRVLDPTGDWAMMLDNAGPYLVVDNVLRLGEEARGVRMTWADQTLVGNVYSQGGRRRRARPLPPHRGEGRRGRRHPRRAARRCRPPRRAASASVFDLPATADAAAIQQAIDQAAATGGPAAGGASADGRPTRSTARSSFPRGATCSLSATGPARSPRGWSGPARPTAWCCGSKARARRRSATSRSRPARRRPCSCDAPDQAGGRIFADQLNTNGPTRPHPGPLRRAAGRPVSSEHGVQFRALQGQRQRRHVGGGHRPR